MASAAGLSCASPLCAEQATNVVAGLSYWQRQPVLATVQGSDWRFLLPERLSYNMTNRFHLLLYIDVLRESERIPERTDRQMRKMTFELLGDRAWSSIRRSLSEAARQNVLDSLTLDDYFRGELGEQLRKTFGAYPERGTLVSPFEVDNGNGLLPGTERYEPQRLPRHWDAGMRILRTNPYAYWTLNTKGPDVHARAYSDKGEVVLHVPLPSLRTFVSGVRMDEYKPNQVEGFVGISGIFYEGVGHIGVHLSGREKFVGIGFEKRF